jgi:hypothetical protein
MGMLSLRKVLATLSMLPFVRMLSLFRSLGSMELGFVSEEDLDKGEEIEVFEWID